MPAWNHAGLRQPKSPPAPSPRLGHQAVHDTISSSSYTMLLRQCSLGSSVADARLQMRTDSSGGTRYPARGNASRRPCTSAAVSAPVTDNGTANNLASSLVGRQDRKRHLAARSVQPRRRAVDLADLRRDPPCADRLVSGTVDVTGNGSGNIQASSATSCRGVGRAAGPEQSTAQTGHTSSRGSQGW